ncbi:MAG: XrtA/PEP-CTERM system TPR-repeat protein PrsT [Pseudomonadota bacterium]
MTRTRQGVLLGGCLFVLHVHAAQPGTNYYEDALRRYDGRDIQGAIVQLKNALQQNPKLLPAQVLLADAYLLTGSPGAAEAALESAQALGADRVVLAPKFAQAYLRQFKYQQLLDQVSHQGLPPIQAAEVLVQRAAAQAALGQVKEAEATLRQAERLSPDLAAVNVAQGTLALQKGDVRAAREQADRAVVLAPNDASVWSLKASVAHLVGDIPAALAAYEKALGLSPDFVDARVARAGLLLDLKRTQEADQDIKILEKSAATDPRAAYLVSLAAARRGDGAATRKALTDAANAIDQLPTAMVRRNAQFLMLGALAHYGLRSMEKAQAYLQSYITLQPRQPGARKLLASIYLDRGDFKETIQLLYPMSEGANPDPQVLTMLASAYLGRKQYTQAAELFERAARIAPGSTDARVGLGLTRLGAGQTAQGLAELEQVFAKDPGQAKAGMVLATHQLRSGEAGRAVDILRKLTQADPDNLEALNLLGTAQAEAKDPAGARATFTQAALKDRNFLPVQFNLVSLDMDQGRQDHARRRLGAILKFRPDHPDALFLLARLEESAGRPDETLRLLERIRAGKVKPLASLAYLAERYLRSGNAKQALVVAQDMEALYPGNPSVQEILGQTYLASGSVDKARATYNRMARNAGFDPAQLTRAAGLLMSVGAYDDAGHALNKALDSGKPYLPAQFQQVELDLRTGKLAAAEKRARDLRAAHPGNAEASRLLGGVYMAQKKPTEALAVFKELWQKAPTGPNTLALFQAHQAKGEHQAAIDLMKGWVGKNPRDVAAESALAEAYLRAGQLQSARSTYETYLQKQSRDAGALNNLANILHQLKDPKALDVARQAYSLAPDNPNVSDTLGWILVNKGLAQEALPYLRDASLRAAGNRAIRYHLGAALHQMGRKAEARKELQAALAGKAEFEGADQARALLTQ